MPEEVKPLPETPNPMLSPITDDPDTLRLLDSGGVPELENEIKEPEPWEKRYTELSEGQKGLMEAIGQLTQAVAAQVGRPQVTERVVERAPEPVAAPARRPWEEKLKPEAAALLKEALRDLFSDQMGEYETQKLNPALQYLVGTQETLLEDRLADRYNEDTCGPFGYEALKDSVHQYREATGNQMSLEASYKNVAFANMMEAVMGSREAQSKEARRQKREVPVDVGGGTPPGAVDPENILDDSEKQAAFAFFGRDDRTGKSRSPKDIEAMWLEHKRGYKKDMMVN
jgi:hypothetical protein